MKGWVDSTIRLVSTNLNTPLMLYSQENILLVALKVCALPIQGSPMDGETDRTASASEEYLYYRVTHPARALF
jgi:hypothetical protein